MRRPDNTIVFGSQNVIAPISSAPRAPASAPASTKTESMWFNTPVVATTDTGTALTPVSRAPVEHAVAYEPALMQPVGGDLMPDRHGFLPRSPDRGLAFAALSLVLVGAAAAGTYFFLGVESTARRPDVATTSVTAAEVQPTETTAPAEAPAATIPTATPANLPWDPPVVDAVKAGPKTIEAAQITPTPREPIAAPAPVVVPKKAAPTTVTPSVDDAALERAGFYRNMNPSPTSNAMVAPPPAPSPPTTPTSEMVPPMNVPPTIDGPTKTTLPDTDTDPALPDVTIKR